MSAQLVIPKMGMTMKDGTVTRWLVPDGADVAQGQPVYLLTTEKVETEVEADASGTLHHAVPEGTTLDAGATVGWLLGPGESPPEGATAAAAPASVAPPPGGAPAGPAGAAARNGARLKVSPNARRVARELGVDVTGLAGTGPGGRIVSEDVEAAAAAPPAAAPAAARSAEAPAPPAPTGVVSPLARRLADQLDVDLAVVAGTGPGGRITTDDVRSASADGGAPRRPDEVHREGPTSIPLKGMRGVIAERMHASLRDMAQLSLGYDVDMDAAVALRSALVSAAEADGTAAPSYTDLVVAAVARALRRHPRLNAVVGDDAVEVQPDVHVGVAVALDEGLMVPVVRDADTLGLGALAAETRRLAERTRSGKLGLDEMSGGTFSVTALGMFGVDFFTPVVNPPNVAILGVGRVRDEVRWRDGVPVPGSALTLSLTIDHRAVDGAPAARFLQDVASLLQAPHRLLL
jgi:pyruvate dehydrogenase E2 component (dihydrolipoamide acetyltransferase)